MTVTVHVYPCVLYRAHASHCTALLHSVIYRICASTVACCDGLTPDEASSLYPLAVHLSSVHLISLYLAGVHMNGVYLAGVHLTGVYLAGVHLLSIVYRSNVHLLAVHLAGVYLLAMHLPSIHLLTVYLSSVHLIGVYLSIILFHPQLSIPDILDLIRPNPTVYHRPCLYLYL
jgi:hypothetical protein